MESFIDNGKAIAAKLWADSRLAPKDVKVADIYDGFSVITMLWLEALGFCGEGEAFDYIQDGRIGLGGFTSSQPFRVGALGPGRLHGANQLMDAILQVMGRSGLRQVADADVALSGDLGPARIGLGLVLARDPG